MKMTKSASPDKGYYIGLLFLALSSLCFVMTMNQPRLANDPFSGMFFLCYGLFVVYFFIVVYANKEKYGKYFRFADIRHSIVLLLLANVSAYALNRNIPVFQMSTDWLTAFLATLNAAMIGFSLRGSRKPDALNIGIAVILSAGLLFSLYQTLYIFPLYGISIGAFWFFGFSLHSFVPLWFSILLFKMLSMMFKASPAYWKSALIGLSIPLGFVLYVTSQWSGINRTIRQAYHDGQVAYASQELPDWVQVSQVLKPNWLTERVLKSNIVYAAFDGKIDNLFFPDNFGFNEKAKHDPIIVVASFFAGPIELDRDQKIELLKAVFDQRHQTERRLWSGDNLSTQDIVTNVQLFPEYRLAYTEKTISIGNDIERSWRWNDTQEAIYSFYLPEGSVVTSASLWVAGKERPSFLTTKNKADIAYTTIVGRERRDPLLLHWREGNRISLRVFPCTPEEARKFKIGVTSLLKLEEDQLIYQNLDFTGPSWRNAKESINLVHEGQLKGFESSLAFSSKGSAKNYIGAYQSDWTIKMDAVPLSTQAFGFNGKSFRMRSLPERSIPFEAKKIYLDINKSWKKNEFEKLWKGAGAKELWVYTHRLEKMNSQNKDELFEHLRRLNYSLFPIHKINDPASALIITKAKGLSPTLSALKGSVFANELNGFMIQNNRPIKVFNFGEERSPFLKMLKELRLIDEKSTSVEQIIRQLQNQSFTENMEDAQSVSLDDAGVLLQAFPSSAEKGDAPDHLMRLFAYNNLMKKIGQNYFQQDKMADQLIFEAEEAHVVTPVSSLIVLETAEDYERFDIVDSKSSLKNASIKSSGAVPEPHEWLLILLALSFTMYLYVKRK